MKILNRLYEVLDHPFTKILDHQMIADLENHIKQNNGSGDTFSNIKAHKLEGDNGHLMSYVRNGALEVHHMDKNNSAGELTSTTDRPNPRFYSTMLHHIKSEALDKGRSARVLSPKDSKLSTHYTSFISKLAKRTGHHIDKNIERSMGHDYDAITIHPKGYTVSLKEYVMQNILHLI